MIIRFQVLRRYKGLSSHQRKRPEDQIVNVADERVSDEWNGLN